MLTHAKSVPQYVVLRGPDVSFVLLYFYLNNILSLLSKKKKKKKEIANHLMSFVSTLKRIIILLLYNYAVTVEVLLPIC